MKEKIVGIIGGMGPEATVDLMNRIIKGTSASDDADHIRMIVDNNPKVPSRIKALLEGGGEDPAPCLQEMARKLHAWGADFLVIPCNTAHYYHTKVQEVVPVPVLNMIRLTCEEVFHLEPDLKTIGLLASTAVLNIGLYKKEFQSFGVNVLNPAEEIQCLVMDIIRKIKTSNYGAEVVETFQLAVNHLLDSGAQGLLIACTELSMFTSAIQSEKPVFDSAQVLAESIIKEVKGSL